MKTTQFIKNGHLFVFPWMLLIIFTLLMIACSKEEKIEPDYSKVYLIKTESIESVDNGNPVHHNFNYDYTETGKVIKVTWENPFGTDVYDYQYGSNSITIYHSSDHGSLDTTLMELNGQGLVISLVNLQQKRITRYIYDDHGYCVNSKYSEYGADTSDIVHEVERAEFTYLDGNLILEKRVYNGTLPGSIQNYYYKDKVNTLGNANKGMGFFGKSSKNLLKTADATDEFDAENRLIKRAYQDRTYNYEFY